MSTRPIDAALQGIDAVLQACDARQRRVLMNVIRETMRRDAQLQQSVAEAREALADLRLGQKCTEFAQHAMLQEDEQAAEMVDELLTEVSRQQ